MSHVAPTTATGGSASSQAASLDQRAWKPRRAASVAIRAITLIAPFVVSFLAVTSATSVVGRPEAHISFAFWIAGLIAISIAAAVATQRVMIRVAPLGFLFKMSLVFPDQAPSRFKTALRAGTARHLQQRARQGGQTVGGAQQGAEDLIALMARLNRHDRLTRGHSERVRAYSVMLGDQIGLAPADLDRLNWAALAHDVGKLEIPESLLNKAGRPTDEEWTLLRTHPGAGAPFIEPLREWLGDWADAATQHHERYDGGGYPLGLAGEHISLSGRIVAIADAYDVMTAARSYKTPLPAAQARAELTRNSGTQFDPHLVRSFLSISVGRTRSVIGPFGWVASFPDIIRAPLTALSTAATGSVAAGAIVLATAAGIIDERPEPPAREDASGNSQPLVGATPATPSTIAVGSTPSVDPEASDGITATSAVTVTTISTSPTFVITTTPPPATTDAPTTMIITTGTTPSTTAVPGTTPATPTPATPTPTTGTAPTTTIAAPTAATTTTTTTASSSVVARNDAAQVKEGGTVSVHVLDNDDFGGSTADLSTLTITAAPAHGTMEVAGRNLIYVPNPDYTGSDRATYRICSVEGECGGASVTITVTT